MRSKNKKLEYSKTHGNFRYVVHNTNSENNSSSHINICAWIEPKHELDALKFFKDISRVVKRTVAANTASNGFRPKAIVDVDIRYNNLRLEKKSFASFDITLFNTTNDTSDTNRRCVKLSDAVASMINERFSSDILISPTKKISETV